ncbi:MAG: hypothetical protein ACJ75J_14960 [Cytophagaceae bacterium]
MIKKIKLLSFLILGIFLSQCSSDPVQKDLINYINVEIPKVSALETEAVDAFQSVAGANYTSDSAMSEKMKSVVVPKYNEFNTKLQAIVPATEEVKKIHGEYVEAAKDQMEAFNLIVDAIEKQNMDEVKKANEDLKKAITLVESWKKDLMETCKAHNVTMDGK